MSAIQVDQVCNSYSPSHEKRQVTAEYFFIYDYRILQRRELFSDSKCVAISMLPGWEWHVNERGVANIRVHWAHGPAPRHMGAVGFLFQNSPRFQTKLDAIDMQCAGYKRTIIAQEVTMIKKFNDDGLGLRLQTATAIIFVDFLDTRSLIGTNLFDDRLELQKWHCALHAMKAIGVPNSYLYSVQRSLAGVPIEELERPFTLAMVEPSASFDARAQRKRAYRLHNIQHHDARQALSSIRAKTRLIQAAATLKGSPPHIRKSVSTIQAEQMVRQLNISTTPPKKSQNVRYQSSTATVGQPVPRTPSPKNFNRISSSARPILASQLVLRDSPLENAQNTIGSAPAVAAKADRPVPWTLGISTLTNEAQLTADLAQVAGEGWSEQ